MIVSNALSCLLNKAVESGQIGYRPSCQRVNLTHLSFTDDILVFTDGMVASLRGILGIFDDFARMYSLRINVAKSTLFDAGRGKKTLERATGVIGISICELPIKYLGLPLITKAMTKLDYEPLVEKICSPFL